MSPPTLDYHGGPEKRPGADVTIWLAYALLALPFYVSAFLGAPYPVPTFNSVVIVCAIGVAAGASVFIVRRRPRNVVGWIGVILWVGLLLLSIGGALFGR